MKKSVFKQNLKVSRKGRSSLKKHKPLLVWFTGLSGAGKSSIASQLELHLFNKSIHCYTLDGDNVRLGLCNDLLFNKEDRKENLRRVGEVANLMLDAGLVCIAAFISPFEEDRNMVKNIVGEENFIEIYISTPIEVCEKRDVKGLYARARAGEIKNFTGISSPFEKPTSPAIEIDTSVVSIDEAINKISSYLEDKIKC